MTRLEELREKYPAPVALPLDPHPWLKRGEVRVRYRYMVPGYDFRPRPRYSQNRSDYGL